MLELMVVEVKGVFGLEAGVEAEVELEVVKGVVEDLTAELNDWTEKGVLD